MLSLYCIPPRLLRPLTNNSITDSSSPSLSLSLRPANGTGSDLGISAFDSGNVSSATTGSSVGRAGCESVDGTDADASTSSSTLTTSEIIERCEVPQFLPHEEFYNKSAPPFPREAADMSQQQQQQQQSGNSAGSVASIRPPPTQHAQPQPQGAPYQMQQGAPHHYHGQQPPQQQFMAQGGTMYHVMQHSVPSNVFVGNVTANVNVMSHPFIPGGASAVAASGQPAFIEHQASHMVHGGHEILTQPQPPPSQQPAHLQGHQPHHPGPQGHMMGGGSRGMRRGRGRGGNNSSHRREYGGGGRMHHQGHLQHGQAQHHHQQNNQSHHHQQQMAGPQQQSNPQGPQPEMMTQIIDQHQVS